jgi:hypothetical protein
MSVRSALFVSLVVVGAVVAFGVTPLSAAGPEYTPWSTPVSLGPTVNSTGVDSGAALSKDGLSLYFYSDRPGGFGGNDIWVSQRNSTDDAWGAPVDLGPTINTSASEFVPAFSRDGHWMFFASNRDGGYGAADVWASWRTNVHDDFAWQAPVNLGPGVNSSANDNGVGYFANDDGAPQLFFGSDRGGPPGNTDLYVSTLQPNGTWGPATLVPGLSSPSADNRPTLTHNGLEIFFYSARAATLGTATTDIWTSTRDSLDSPWSTPVNVGPPVNTTSTDIHPYVSSDDQTLVFSSNRPGSAGLDLYMSTRSKIHGKG